MNEMIKLWSINRWEKEKTEQTPKMHKIISKQGSFQTVYIEGSVFL